ncbi:MAG: DUF4340 domain-containing protein [Bacteroidia bacterium]|nr:DUF4340 domain-containing protein [Bacteroidia bacterium]MDW8235195.1 DUF4340 domain-containing protein [Bacteroidia bacterium]
MTKGTPWATIGLVVVLLAAITAVIWGSRIANQRAEAERNFAFPDTANIVEIHLVEKHADTILRRIDLYRRPKGWIIADTLEVFDQPLQTLLYTLAKQKARAAVPSTALRNVLKFLQEHRIEVTLVFRDGRHEVFFVGGPTPDEKASYMIKPGQTQPYEVYLPGLEGYITTRYYADIGVWQPNKIFEARMADIRSIQIDYAGEPGESWHLERPQPESAWQLSSGEPLDSLRVAEYLSGFTGPFYADDWVHPDSLIGAAPLAEVALKLYSGKNYRWTVYKHTTSPIHYYIRLWHSPYFTYTISSYRLDGFLYRRRQFIRQRA